MTTPALSAVCLHKAFGSTRALKGANLELEAGKVRALLGENGSGKSTLAKILAGTQPPDRGIIRRDGAQVQIRDPAAAQELGIAVVFQELSLVPDLDVIDNLFLAREFPRRVSGIIDRKREERACRVMIEQLGLTLDIKKAIRNLGMAQKQMLEIGKAISQRPAVLILDEPTASLTRREVDHLFILVRRLRDNGTAILYVTHHISEVLEIADFVSIMRDGHIVADRDITPQTTEAHLVELLLGRTLTAHSPPQLQASRAPLLEVEELRTSRTGSTSFHIDEGEVVGIYGVVGCGREGIGRTLVGLQPRLGGTVTLAGTAFRPRSPAQALAGGIGFLAADRKQEGILAKRSIRENLTLSNLSRMARGGVVQPQRERAATSEQLASLGVKCASAEDAIVTLSGGNQQKVLLGRALAARPKVMVMEDPTAGIDVGAKQDLYRIIERHRSQGMSFLWMSSDLTETLTVCDRVYAMYRGRIVQEIVSPTLADEERLLAAVLGRDSLEWRK